MKSYLVTVSDDRMGRKGGVYGVTQQRITTICDGLVDYQYHPNINDVFKTDFYRNHKQLLDHIDPAKNGRVYKPFAISEVFTKAIDGDIIIYNDCSPEMWQNPSGLDYIPNYKYSVKHLYDKVYNAGGILAPFVRWDTRKMGPGENGIHTHMNFTTSTCIKRMFSTLEHENHYMCASGLFAFIVDKKSRAFIDSWLHYNTIDECCALGKANKVDDYSFWGSFEDKYKMGHRHDQSIAGLLMNEYNPLLINHIVGDWHVYNFINYCYNKTAGYEDSRKGPNIANRICKGDTVKNKAGVELRIFEVWPDHATGKEIYIVGKHREAAWQETEENLTIWE